MRDGHRADAERLLARAVEEEVRRSGGRTDGALLLSRARGALDDMAQAAVEEYEAYTRALDETEAGRLTFGQRYAREGAGTPLLVAAVAAVAACVADLSLGTGAGTAFGAGAAVGVVGAAATVAKVTASHLPAASRRAGALAQPGGPEQLRLQWLTALEVRGIRPFLDQQRVITAATGAKRERPSCGAPTRARRHAGAVSWSSPSVSSPSRTARSRDGAPSCRGSRSGCRRPGRVRRPSRRWWCCTARRARGVRRWRCGRRTR